MKQERERQMLEVTVSHVHTEVAVVMDIGMERKGVPCDVQMQTGST